MPLIEKVRIGPTDQSEDVREIRDVLDRILDKGLVMDPAYSLTLMDPRPSKDIRLVISFTQTCTMES